MNIFTDFERKVRSKHVVDLAKQIQLHLRRANQRCKPEEGEGLKEEAPQGKCKIEYLIVADNLREVLRFGQTFQTAALNTVEHFWKKAHALDCRLFVSNVNDMLPAFRGDVDPSVFMAGPIQFHTFVYLVPSMPVYDIAEFVEFGTKGLDEPERRWGEARKSLKAAAVRWNFEIISAYNSLLIGRFIKPLSSKIIKQELYETLPYSELEFDDTISKTGFEIWRD